MLQNILPIIDKFDLFLLNVSEVGGEFNPQSLLKLKGEGKHVILLSNATEREAALDKIQEQRGVIKGVHYDKIVSSGELAYQCFSEDNRAMKYCVYGKPADELFVDSPYVEVKAFEKADFIYLGVPGVKKDGEWQNCQDIKPFEDDLKKFFKHDMVLICANPDLQAVLEGGDKTVVRQGLLARFYQELGGEVEFFGKPYPDIFALALEDYENVDFSRILMLGDSLESDILGGNSIGIKTALLVNGMSKINMEEEGQFESVDDYCQDMQIVPDYMLESF